MIKFRNFIAIKLFLVVVVFSVFVSLGTKLEVKTMEMCNGIKGLKWRKPF